jgi:hypothetical protein
LDMTTLLGDFNTSHKFDFTMGFFSMDSSPLSNLRATLNSSLHQLSTEYRVKSGGNASYCWSHHIAMVLLRGLVFQTTHTVCVCLWLFKDV